jgi:hypothetical protein
MVDPPDEKPASGAGDEAVAVVFRSVGSAALEGVEEHVPHRADIGLDPVEAVAINLAIFAALLVSPVAFGDEFPVEAVQQGLIREGLAGGARAGRAVDVTPAEGPVGEGAEAFFS